MVHTVKCKGTEHSFDGHTLITAFTLKCFNPVLLLFLLLLLSQYNCI